MAFEFDTSGYIGRGESPHGPLQGRVYAWPDLSPFVQGMIAGMMEEISEWATRVFDDTTGRHEPIGFRYISPEALARLIKDGEKCPRNTGLNGDDFQRRQGAIFWEDRQTGYGSDPQSADTWGFPSLRASLNEGKIELTGG